MWRSIIVTLITAKQNCISIWNRKCVHVRRTMNHIIIISYHIKEFNQKMMPCWCRKYPLHLPQYRSKVSVYFCWTHAQINFLFIFFKFCLFKQLGSDDKQNAKLRIRVSESISNPLAVQPSPKSAADITAAYIPKLRHHGNIWYEGCSWKSGRHPALLSTRKYIQGQSSFTAFPLRSRL